MNYESQIRSQYSRMSKSFVKLADFILDYPVATAFMTATELAHSVNVDTTTVVRFSQFLGFTGYPDLLRDIRGKIKNQLNVQPGRKVEKVAAKREFESAIRDLGRVFERGFKLIENEKVEALAEQISVSEKIVLIPDSLASPVAYTLVDILERGGFSVSISRHGSTDLARTVRLASPQVLLLSIEVVGDVPFIPRALSEAQKAGIPVAAILGAASFETARVVELSLCLQSPPSAGLTIILVNGLVYALGEVIKMRFPERFENVDHELHNLFQKINSGE